MCLSGIEMRIAKLACNSVECGMRNAELGNEPNPTLHIVNLKSIKNSRDRHKQHRWQEKQQEYPLLVSSILDRNFEKFHFFAIYLIFTKCCGNLM